MKIRTESGVSISSILDGSSILLHFNSPVCTIELTKDESLRVASLLTNFTNQETATPEVKKVALQPRQSNWRKGKR